MTIRVALLDDHPMVVGGLVGALATDPELSVVAHGATVDEARSLLGSDDIDVALLDVRLADGNGLQAVADRGPRQRPAVLVVSTFGLAQYVAAAVKFGAAGYLSKTVPLPELLRAIHVVAAGGSVYTADQLEQSYVALTPKEREVLRLAMAGLSNKEIGAGMGISKKTVEGHLSDIFAKYGILGGRIELSIRAATEGWLEIEGPPR
jgi:DNA-binding NarL/FixJ family response regulator